MSPESITFLVLGAWLLAAVFLPLLGSRLVRHDLQGGVKTQGAIVPASRILEDLRPVQDLAVDFFAHSEPCARLLTLLARSRRPLDMDALAGPPFGSEWAALWMMRVAGLVRLDNSQVLLTETAREVHRRISVPPHRATAGERFQQPSAYDALFVPLPVDTGADAHLNRVREAQQSNAYESVRQTPRPASLPIGELRKAKPATTTKNFQREIDHKTTSMKKRNIIITAADHEELSRAIAAAGKLSGRGRAEMSALKAELARAKIVATEKVRPDVITMNSRAELLDLETGERMDFTLVFPLEANIEEGKISVLAPLGTAMLGYRVGDEFAWKVPYGIRRLKVAAIHFQPEMALTVAA